MPYQERRQLAEERMAEAKRQFSDAAKAALRGDPRSRELAAAAFEAIQGAREELRRLVDVPR
jgi:hypothetical protein